MDEDNCVDIDECAERDDVCNPTTFCVNTIVSTENQDSKMKKAISSCAPVAIAEDQLAREL